MGWLCCMVSLEGYSLQIAGHHFCLLPRLQCHWVYLNGGGAWFEKCSQQTWKGQLLTKEHVCSLWGKCQWDGSDGCLECCQVLTFSWSGPWSTWFWTADVVPVSSGTWWLWYCDRCWFACLEAWIFFQAKWQQHQPVNILECDLIIRVSTKTWLMLAMSTVFHHTPLLNYVSWPSRRIPQNMPHCWLYCSPFVSCGSETVSKF